MGQQEDGTGRAQLAGEWSTVDELNWAADRAVMRKLKMRGEEPSEWLATEYRELTCRRMGLPAGRVK